MNTWMRMMRLLTHGDHLRAERGRERERSPRAARVSVSPSLAAREVSPNGLALDGEAQVTVLACRRCKRRAPRSGGRDGGSGVFSDETAPGRCPEGASKSGPSLVYSRSPMKHITSTKYSQVFNCRPAFWSTALGLGEGRLHSEKKVRPGPNAPAEASVLMAGYGWLWLAMAMALIFPNIFPSICATDRIKDTHPK